jgi:excisionase family DNA binding protein
MRGGSGRKPNDMGKEHTLTPANDAIGSVIFDEPGAAAYLHTSTTHLRRLRNDGRVRFTRLGRFIRYRKEWLDELIDEAS